MASTCLCCKAWKKIADVKNTFIKKRKKKRKVWVFSRSRVLSAVMTWPGLNVDTGNIQSEGHKGGLSFSLTASH